MKLSDPVPFCGGRRYDGKDRRGGFVMSIPGVLLLAVLGQSAPDTARAKAPGSDQNVAVPTSTVCVTIKNAPIFKVLVWYHRDQALGTFKYQEYDLRKSEYTPAVDAWIGKVRSEFPAYVVIVRDVDANLKAGETEKLKVGSVIKGELAVAAALSGIAIGTPAALGPGPRGVLSSDRRTQTRIGPLSTDRGFLDRPGATFPVPIPYPRPHP
jgi:hypothetical protein